MSCGAFFSTSKKGQDNNWRIHCDVKPIPGQDQPERAVVLYMNENKTDGLNGTALWEHKTHGINLASNNIEEYDRILTEDSEDLSKWKLQSVIGGKKNRLLSYPCNYFHSKYPNEFDESRVVFVMFYKIKKIMWSNRWIKGQDYPEWADAEVYKKTIQGGYLYNGETPKEAYRRVAKAVARRLKKTEMEEGIF